MYSWDWTIISRFSRAFLFATIETLELNLFIIILGTTLGLILALFRKSPNKVLRILSSVYIDLFRTLPVLVLLVWFFYCVPILLYGVRFSPFISAVIVFSLNLSAFVAEIIRTGIDAVPTSYVDDAKISGLSTTQIYRFIVLPISIRSMIPPIVSQYINTIKLSVLAAIIGVPELYQVTIDIIGQVNRPLELYTFLAIIFLVLLLPGTIISKNFETMSFFKRVSK